MGKNPKPLHENDYKQWKPTNNVILTDPRPAHLQHTTTAELNNFLISQQMFPRPTMWQDCKISYEDYAIESSRRNVLMESTDIFLQNLAKSIEKFSLNNSLSTDSAVHLSGTELQAECAAWRMERKFRITASIFKDFHQNPSRSTYNLLWSRSKDISSLPSIKWGREKEEDARLAFEKCFKPVRKCGLYVSKDLPWFGASPDGVGLEHDFLLEIKCPYIQRTTKPDDFSALNPAQIRNHFCEKNDEQVSLKKSHKYYWQVQLQMWVTGIPLTKFVV